MTDRMPRLGLILCGGRSSRMGQDKAQLAFAGSNLLNHCCQVVGCQVDQLFVAAAPQQTLPAVNGKVEVIPDPASFEGPLFALDNVFQVFNDRFENWECWVSTVDLPLITTALIKSCFSNRKPKLALLLQDEAGINPLAGIFCREAATRIHQLVQSGERRARKIAEACDCSVINVADLDHHNALLNVNTPQDLAAALSRGATACDSLGLQSEVPESNPK